MARSRREKMRVFKHVKPAPANTMPIIRFLFAEMERQRIGMYDMAERSGVNAITMQGWRKRRSPNLSNIEACLNVLGYTIQYPVPIEFVTGEVVVYRPDRRRYRYGTVNGIEDIPG